MTRGLVLILLGALVLASRFVHLGSFASNSEEATMSLGFVMLGSYWIGRQMPRFGIPMITGYMIAGILFGPYLVSYWSERLVMLRLDVIDELSLIDHIALGLIAFTAGGELRLSLLKARFRPMALVTVLQFIFPFLGVTAVIYLLGGSLPSLQDLGPRPLLVSALLLGCCAVANSPATTIAVATELRCRGPLTSLVLGVTVMKDVLILGAFTVTLGICQSLLRPGSGLDSAVALEILWEMVGSVVTGIGLGFLLIVYIEKIRVELPMVVLGTAFLAVAGAQHVRLSGLLICLIAGFLVENFSPHGETLVLAVERYSLPVYVVFFTMAGASLALDQLSDSWLLALVFLGSRWLFVYLSTFMGARLTREGPTIEKYAWMGFLAQAGVTLGLASLIARAFPDFGPRLETVLVGVIALSQALGPVAFRYALARADEIGKAE